MTTSRCGCGVRAWRACMSALRCKLRLAPRGKGSRGWCCWEPAAAGRLGNTLWPAVRRRRRSAAGPVPFVAPVRARARIGRAPPKSGALQLPVCDMITGKSLCSWANAVPGWDGDGCPPQDDPASPSLLIFCPPHPRHPRLPAPGRARRCWRPARWLAWPRWASWPPRGRCSCRCTAGRGSPCCPQVGQRREGVPTSHMSHE